MECPAEGGGGGGGFRYGWIKENERIKLPRQKLTTCPLKDVISISKFKRDRKVEWEKCFSSVCYLGDDIKESTY